MPNWLDTEGRQAGLATYRWFWGSEQPEVRTRVVSISDVAQLMPADTPQFDADLRARQVRARQDHVAWRFPHDDGSAPGSPSGQPLVVARSVERTFLSKQSRVEALGPVDLDITAGDFVCIVGPSGCGKSTLLRIIAGLIRPSEGSIEIRGRKGAAPSIATVFQNYGMFPWKTVQENIRFGLDVTGVPRAEANERAERWIRRLGLEQFRKHHPGTLSGGMQQRVAIARALAVEPELLLMDEPFAALDAQLRHVMQDELLALWQADQRTALRNPQPRRGTLTRRPGARDVGQARSHPGQHHGAVPTSSSSRGPHRPSIRRTHRAALGTPARRSHPATGACRHLSHERGFEDARRISDVSVETAGARLPPGRTQTRT